jgi:hypothetical protein
MSRPINGDNNGNTKMLYNYRHKLDPLVMLKPLNAGKLFKDTDHCKDISVTHIHDINIHSLSHYWKHPVVHQTIMDRILPGKISYSEAMEAESKFVHTVIDPETLPEGLQDEAKVLQEIMLINEMIKAERAKGGSLLKGIIKAIYLTSKGYLQTSLGPIQVETNNGEENS